MYVTYKHVHIFENCDMVGLNLYPCHTVLHWQFQEPLAWISTPCRSQLNPRIQQQIPTFNGKADLTVPRLYLLKLALEALLQRQSLVISREWADFKNWDYTICMNWQSSGTWFGCLWGAKLQCINAFRVFCSCFYPASINGQNWAQLDRKKLLCISFPHVLSSTFNLPSITVICVPQWWPQRQCKARTGTAQSHSQHSPYFLQTVQHVTRSSFLIICNQQSSNCCIHSHNTCFTIWLVYIACLVMC